MLELLQLKPLGAAIFGSNMLEAETSGSCVTRLPSLPQPKLPLLFANVASNMPPPDARSFAIHLPTTLMTSSWMVDEPHVTRL